MRYCNQCHRITAGEALFCNFCGRSYDVRLCPHRHPNPRTAQICSQCGSWELSSPHPKVPLWLAPLVLLLSVLPGLVLLLLSVLFLIGLIQVLVSSQQLLFEFFLLGLLLAVLWWLYLQLPGWLRKGLSKLFGPRGGDRHAH
jgi:hypothetical protein